MNNGVRRRKDRRPPPRASSTSIVASNKSVALMSRTGDKMEIQQVQVFSESVSNVKDETDSSQVIKPSQSAAAKDFFAKGSSGKQTTTTKTPPLKRDSSSIFKSFAKATPKAKTEDYENSAAASGLNSAFPSGLEDEPMKDVSDDEEDSYVPPPQPATKDLVASSRKARKEREEALKKMMEEEDSEDEPVAKAYKDEFPSAIEPPEPKETMEVSNGRRRGRRRVMKKKTVKDNEGYLGKFSISPKTRFKLLTSLSHKRRSSLGIIF
jgi:DNA polymerase delta subunit 3